MGNGPVLAENTAQIAVREKNGTRAMLSDQGYLLAKMGLGAVDDNVPGRLAESFFSLQPIHAALTGAEFARLEDSAGLFNPLRQFTRILQCVIGGPPRTFVLFIGMQRDRRTKKGAAKDEKTSEEISARYFHVVHPIAVMGYSPFFKEWVASKVAMAFSTL
jgi:hypothetical protein